ncbi:MAG: ABC transporter permease [Verrucomicrobiota bacterium]
MAETEIAATAAKASPKPTRRVRGWMPLATMTCLMLVIGGYAAGRNADFYSSFNLNSLLGSSGTLPLALVAMGQVNALMVGGFDVSVGALMTLIVVVGSKGLLTVGGSWWSFVLGSIALLAIGLGVGVLNAFLIRKIRLPSIIATLATLSVMQGISLVLRPVPDGEIDPQVLDKLNASVSFVPYAFIGVVVLAAVWDFWLYGTAGGLAARAVGSDEASSRRIGIPSEAINWRAFISCSMMATLAGFFLIAQVGIGDARVGSGFALTSIAAAVLGGASLLGGKGSYVGAVIGALFLSLIINILPLPNILPGFLLQWSDALPLICIGAFTLLALVVYQGPELWERLQVFWRDLRSGREPEPAPATIQR